MSCQRQEMSCFVNPWQIVHFREDVTIFRGMINGVISVFVRSNKSKKYRRSIEEISNKYRTNKLFLSCAHGFGCDQHMWRFITPAFENDHKIILFDYVGAGRSDKSAYNPERYASLQGYAQDVLDMCRELDLHDIIFVGHSVSSMIGLLAAIEKPQYFKKLVMIGPSACYINDENYIGGFERVDITGLLETMEKNYIGWSNFMAPNIMGNTGRPELGNELADSFCSTDPVIARQFAEATFLSDNRKDLKKLKLPSLVLQCSDDIIAPVQVGEYLAQNLVNGTLRIMKATGHCPHMSEPAETISLIREYLTNAG